MTQGDFTAIRDVFGFPGCCLALRSQQGISLRTGAAYDLDPLEFSDAAGYTLALTASINLAKEIAAQAGILDSSYIFLVQCNATGTDDGYTDSAKNKTLPKINSIGAPRLVFWSDKLERSTDRLASDIVATLVSAPTIFQDKTGLPPVHEGA